MKDTKEKLGGLTVGLHWLVGLTIIVLLAIGIYMTEYEVGSLYPIHKSIGVLIFFIILANPQQNPPRLAAGMNAFLNRGGYKGERSVPLIRHRPLR